ncbi:MAG TPA: dodecin family protein [Hyphomicrobiaceae bacterium]|nr:dodecin family protein [Hyphomicrobiaceae bacterium]
MSVLKVIELMSESPKSWEDAAQQAVAKAAKTVKNVRSLWVKEFAASVANGKIATYRVTCKVTFEVKDKP